ncbi:MAG: hypothetical protein ABIP97_11320 [Chthoniobacterales bacterium]
MKLFALSIILSLILVAPGYGKDGTSVFTLSHIAEAPTGDTREMSLKFGNSVEKVFVDQTVLLNDKEIASATLIEGTPVRIQSNSRMTDAKNSKTSPNTPSVNASPSSWTDNSFPHRPSAQRFQEAFSKSPEISIRTPLRNSSSP